MDQKVTSDLIVRLKDALWEFCQCVPDDDKVWEAAETVREHLNSYDLAVFREMEAMEREELREELRDIEGRLRAALAFREDLFDRNKSPEKNGPYAARLKAVIAYVESLPPDDETLQALRDAELDWATLIHCDADLKDPAKWVRRVIGTVTSNDG